MGLPMVQSGTNSKKSSGSVGPLQASAPPPSAYHCSSTRELRKFAPGARARLRPGILFSQHEQLFQTKVFCLSRTKARAFA